MQLFFMILHYPLTLHNPPLYGLAFTALGLGPNFPKPSSLHIQPLYILYSTMCNKLPFVISSAQSKLFI